MPQRWRALLILTVARLSLGFQVQSIAAVGPSLESDIGLSLGEIGMLIGLYYAPGLVLAFPSGLLGQRFSDKRVIVLSLLAMTLGATVACFAWEINGLILGRVLSGAGAAALNVVMTKMVTDWFADRSDITLAMAVFINSMPVGMGLAMLSLSWIAEAESWNAALGMAAGISLAALLLICFSYRKHPNDGPAAASIGWISRREILMVSLAGAAWGIFNGTVSVMTGFAPLFLGSHGLSVEAAALLVGFSIWFSAASVQVSGFLAQKRTRWGLLVAVGTLGWAVCLPLLDNPDLAIAGLLASGMVMGLPVAVFLVLPSVALRPESRAIGMGIFQTWLYVGTTFMPPVAGWMQAVSGFQAAPLTFAAVMIASNLLFYRLFLAVLRKRPAL
ncbi:CynX/NimT family MFS transporter [Heliomarina baculiformis]|uniref:MFS transporter n=1 Tax=Heliomarina baculiformis TaxID=2872036 RepID=UPI001EE1E7C1|nr:MFS transporter [Heliomarina baculiformis]